MLEKVKTLFWACFLTYYVTDCFEIFGQLPLCCLSISGFLCVFLAPFVCGVLSSEILSFCEISMGYCDLEFSFIILKNATMIRKIAF